MVLHRAFLILLSILFIAVPSHAQEKVLVRGKVTGFDGKPVAEAHAHFLRLPWGANTRHEYTIEIGSNGHYLMKFPEGLYEVSFTGINHQRTTPVAVFLEKGQENIINARLPLSPFYEAEQLDAVRIMYQEYGSSQISEKEMKRTGSGVFEITVAVDPREEAFLYHLGGIMPKRFVNGTQSDEYRYDEDGDYESVIHLADDQTAVTVTFDRSLLPDPEPGNDTAYTGRVSGMPLQQEEARLAERMLSFQDSLERQKLRYRDGFLVVPGDPTATAIRWPEDSAAFAAQNHRLTEWLREKKDSVLTELRALPSGDIEKRRALSLLLLEFIRGIDMDDCRAEIREAFRIIPPDSPWWGLSTGFMYSMEFIQPDSLSYVRDVAHEHPSPSVAAGAYTAWLHQLVETGQRDRQAAVFREAMEKFRGTPWDAGLQQYNPDQDVYMQQLAQNVERDLMMFFVYFPDVRSSWEETMKQPHVDFPMPGFRLPSIEDPGHVLTEDSLEGHPYLIAVVSAMLDDQQFGFYQLMHDKYAWKGLRFVFLLSREDDTAPTWEDIKTAGFSLPGFVANLKDAVFERPMFRHPTTMTGNTYVVNAAGVVIASGERTAPLEQLYLTLGRLFGDEN